MDSNKNLIYGKNNITHIVHVAVEEKFSTIFREVNGELLVEHVPTELWILLHDKKYNNLISLEGNQYYKYLFSTNSLEHYNSARKKLGRSDFYSIWNTQENFMIKSGITYFKDMKIEDLSVLSFDIESDGLKQTSKSEVYCITNTFRKNGKYIRKGFYLDNYKTQAEMLLDWTRWVREINPSVILGFNILIYDFPYLQHVADLNNITLDLGRDGSSIKFNNRTSEFRKDGSQSYEYRNLYIYGREVIDGWMLSIKYDVGRIFNSYGLKSIINQLGLEKPGRTFIDASKIKHYYYDDKKMWELVKVYAEEDSDDALKLFDIMAPSYFYFTSSVSKTFQQMILSATGSQINNMMVRSYLQDNHSIAKSDQIESFQGAISFGIPKLYKNVYKLDIASLYPSIMRQYKIYSKQKDPKANFYQLVDTFTIQRLNHKKIAKETNDKYYSDLEQSEKIAINSMYGTLGASGLNYNYLKGADEVTRRGREILCKAIEFTTSKTMEHWKELAGGEDELDESELDM